MTGNDIISQAFAELGIGQPGESLSTAQLNQGLIKLNLLLDQWGMEQLMSPNSSSFSANLVAGQAAYTIGVGGFFNIPLPDRITGAVMTDVVGNFTYDPLNIVGLDVWNTYSDKLVAQGPPMALFYDQTPTQQTTPTSRGLNLTLTLTAKEGVVTAATISTAGTNYLANDIVYVQGGNNDCTIQILTVNAGAALTISILNGGTGYVTTTGTAGTGCQITTLVTGGSLSGSQTVTTAGTGYSVGGNLLVAGGTAGVVQVTAVNGSGGVLGVYVMNGGYGYTTATLQNTSAAVANTAPNTTSYQAGTINLYPFPDAARTYKMTLNYDANFNELSALSAEVSLPKSYRRGLIYTLAEDLCSGNGLNVPPTVAKYAADFKRLIGARNVRMLASDTSMGTTSKQGRSNIYSGQE